MRARHLTLSAAPPLAALPFHHLERRFMTSHTRIIPVFGPDGGGAGRKSCGYFRLRPYSTSTLRLHFNGWHSSPILTWHLHLSKQAAYLYSACFVTQIYRICQTQVLVYRMPPYLNASQTIPEVNATTRKTVSDRHGDHKLVQYSVRHRYHLLPQPHLLNPQSAPSAGCLSCYFASKTSPLIS